MTSPSEEQDRLRTHVDGQLDLAGREWSKEYEALTAEAIDLDALDGSR